MAVRRSLLLSLAQRYLTLALSLGSTIVLARLLTPGEMGMFFIAAALILAANTIANFGVHQHIVQERRLTPGRYRAATGVIVLSSLAAFALVQVLAAPLAGFFREPGLAAVLAVYGLVLLTVPLNTPAIARMQRDMRFGAVLVIGVAGTVVQVATAIWLATRGHGAMSLAWAAVVEQGMVTLVCALLRDRESWARPAIRGWRRVVGPGLSLSAAHLMQEMGNLAPQLAIGRMQGMDAAGLFNRGLTAVTLFQRCFVDAVKPVVLPAFARAHRDGVDTAGPLVRATALVAAIAWPFFAVTALLAPQVVMLLFGGQWGAAVPVVRILALVGMVMPFCVIQGEVLVALGRAGRVFRIQTVSQALRVAVTVVLAAIGIEAVALGLAAVALVQAALILGALRAATGVRLRVLAGATLSSVAITAAAAAGPLAVALLDAESRLGALPDLALGGGLSAIGWVWALVATRHPLAGELRDLLAGARRPYPLRASRQ
jgi:O-antigen/teichoic acid export membrane protein